MRRKRKSRLTKQPVSPRALLARVNRMLDKTGDGKVYKARSGNPADYFQVLRNGSVVKYVELQDIAEELGVLKSWEVLSK